MSRGFCCFSSILGFSNYSVPLGPINKMLPESHRTWGRYLGKFLPVCTTGLSESQSHYSLFCGHIIDPFLVTSGQICNFRDPNLVTFYLCMYLTSNEEHFTIHLQYKHSGTCANLKYEELFYPKNQKMCDPILVTLLKMRLHYSQSSRENATPSSGTSPLASYKEVPPGYLNILSFSATS